MASNSFRCDNSFKLSVEQMAKVCLVLFVTSIFVTACASPSPTPTESTERRVPLPTAAQLDVDVIDTMPTLSNWQRRLGDFAESQRPGIENFEWWQPVKGSFRKVDDSNREAIKITDYKGWYGCGMAQYASTSGGPKLPKVPVAGVFRDNKLLAQLYWDEEASEVCRMLPSFVVTDAKEDFSETGFSAHDYIPPIIDEAASNVKSNDANSHIDMDLSNSGFEVVKSYDLQRELCRWNVVTTKTGYLELCRANNLSLPFAVQRLSDFKRGMRARGLFGIDGQVDPSVRRHTFSTGPGLYAQMSHQGQNCVTFMINTGVKTMIQGSKPATRSLFAGMNCSPTDGDEAVKLLLSEIDKVRIRR